MDREKYNTKLLTMLKDVSVYEQLKKDPSAGLERKMNSTLLQLNRCGKIPDFLYNRLRSSGGQTPRIYGLPKIHKDDVPLRPIVSFYTSPTYELSKHLSYILSPLVGNTSSFVMNSKDFVNFISSQKLEHEVLVSFDVVSLFTNIPIDLAVTVARRNLESDDTLEDRTQLDVDDIIQLLEMCLNATFLQFQETCYQQKQGTAMGSPVSVTVANLVMEDVEQRALSSFQSTEPLFWKRYVDDTCTAIHPDVIDIFHQHINNIEPSIQFTCEIEQDNHLPFLDVLLTKEDDGTISTSVYRKKTHTDQYLQFSSHHPLSHKVSVIKTLFTRAESLSSTSIERATEEVHITEALQTNGYPTTLITKNRTSRPPVTDIPTEKPSAKVTLPYVQGQSEAIRRILQKLNITTSFKPVTTLRQILSHPKDPIPTLNKTGVVYRIPCADCDGSYVGQTGRTLGQRIKEHRKAVSSFNTDTSALAEHVLTEDHRIDWEAASILDQHPFTQSRCMVESWYINHLPNTLNRERGPLPEAYQIRVYRDHAHMTEPLLQRNIVSCEVDYTQV